MLEKTNNVTFTINEETRNAILEICKDKPFNKVFNIMKLIEKDVLTEQEANVIINVLGNFPYSEVAEFFNNIQKYFKQNNTEQEIKQIKK